MKKLKKLFFVLLTGIMILGGSVACLADTSYPSVDEIKLQYNYYFILYASSNDTYYLFNSDVPLIYTGNSVLKPSNGTFSYENFIYSDDVWKSVSKSSNVPSVSFGKTDEFLFSNYDILNKDGSVFFYTEVIPVAKVAEQLPEVVRKQTEIILPIVIGGLALLIGSLTLLPKLRNFLLV